MIQPSELKLRNIRFRNGRYAVRVMRRKPTLSEARTLEKFIRLFVTGVGIYEDQIQKSFIVQTYQEYDNIIDAIKVRDFLESKLKLVQ